MTFNPSFYRYLAQCRFAEALAHWPAEQPLSSGWALWAAYRLGLYATVSNDSWDGKHRWGGVAMAVSLAACGRGDEAGEVVSRLIARHGTGRYLVTLADALAPFMPVLALEVLQHRPSPSLLHVALLLRTGAQDEAVHMLHVMKKSGSWGRQPEAHLFETNVLGGAPDVQLQRLNAYFSSFGLPGVSLVNPALPPSAMNVQSASPLPAVDGPRVSVLMTAFDASERIDAAIRGLLAQTWRNLEIVVADDASRDDTAAVVQALADEDKRVRFVRMPCNVGTYIAKTTGLELASGEFVTCHDSDDWSHPQRIERQVRPLIENSRLAATTSRWVRVEDSGMFYARPVHPLARLNPASPMFRRRQVEADTGLWDVVRTGADSEFHARLKLVYGRSAVLAMKLPLALGAHRLDSLMTAPDTGYSATGFSPTRLAYWEAWTHGHIDALRAGRRPVMPRATQPRPYEAPERIRVPPADIERCMQVATDLKA